MKQCVALLFMLIILPSSFLLSCDDRHPNERRRVYCSPIVPLPSSMPTNNCHTNEPIWNPNYYGQGVAQLIKEKAIAEEEKKKTLEQSNRFRAILDQFNKELTSLNDTNSKLRKAMRKTDDACYIAFLGAVASQTRQKAAEQQTEKLHEKLLTVDAENKQLREELEGFKLCLSSETTEKNEALLQVAKLKAACLEHTRRRGGNRQASSSKNIQKPHTRAAQASSPASTTDETMKHPAATEQEGAGVRQQLLAKNGMLNKPVIAQFKC